MKRFPIPPTQYDPMRAVQARMAAPSGGPGVAIPPTKYDPVARHGASLAPIQRSAGGAGPPMTFAARQAAARAKAALAKAGDFQGKAQDKLKSGSASGSGAAAPQSYVRGPAAGAAAAADIKQQNLPASVSAAAAAAAAAADSDQRFARDWEGAQARGGGRGGGFGGRGRRGGRRIGPGFARAATGNQRPSEQYAASLSEDQRHKIEAHCASPIAVIGTDEGALNGAKDQVGKEARVSGAGCLSIWLWTQSQPKYSKAEYSGRANGDWIRECVANNKSFKVKHVHWVAQLDGGRVFAGQYADIKTVAVSSTEEELRLILALGYEWRANLLQRAAQNGNAAAAPAGAGGAAAPANAEAAAAAAAPANAAAAATTVAAPVVTVTIPPAVMPPAGQK